MFHLKRIPTRDNMPFHRAVRNDRGEVVRMYEFPVNIAVAVEDRDLPAMAADIQANILAICDDAGRPLEKLPTKVLQRMDSGEASNDGPTHASAAGGGSGVADAQLAAVRRQSSTAADHRQRLDTIHLSGAIARAGRGLYRPLGRICTARGARGQRAEASAV